MVCYVVSGGGGGGGGVFSVGSINSYCSLAWDNSQNGVAAMTANVLREFRERDAKKEKEIVCLYLSIKCGIIRV